MYKYLIHLPDDLANKLREKAYNDRVSRISIIRSALVSYFKLTYKPVKKERIEKKEEPKLKGVVDFSM